MKQKPKCTSCNKPVKVNHWVDGKLYCGKCSLKLDEDE